MLRKPLLKVYNGVLATAIGVTSGTVGTVISIADTDSIVAKLAGTVSGTPVTIDVYVQTTDDGGTTFYDVAHFAQVIASITNANALWAYIPCASGQAKYVGAAAAASASAGTITGLPFMDRTMQIQTVISGTVSSASTLALTLYAASQSGGF